MTRKKGPEVCRRCGRQFLPRAAEMVCDDCRPPWKASCKRCGKEYLTKSKTSRYCEACRRELHRAQSHCWYLSCRKTPAENRELPFGQLSRPLTPDTPFLSQKWKREGMSPGEIADILNRPVSDILFVLTVPLTPGQRIAMEEFLTGRKQRGGKT